MSAGPTSSVVSGMNEMKELGTRLENWAMCSQLFEKTSQLTAVCCCKIDKKKKGRGPPLQATCVIIYMILLFSWGFWCCCVRKKLFFLSSWGAGEGGGGVLRYEKFSVENILFYIPGTYKIEKNRSNFFFCPPCLVFVQKMSQVRIYKKSFGTAVI